MADERRVLGESVDRLRGLVEAMTPDQWRGPSYCDDWTVAQVLSHLGSGAEISRNRIEQAFGAPEVDPQPIWDTWNAKDPEAMVADALAADRALLDRLDAVPEDERAGFAVPFGPMEFDYDRFIAFRLNEHSLHTWDVAVVDDPTAGLPAEDPAIVIEAVPMIAGFVGKPTGTTKDLTVATTAPDRRFAVALTDEGVSITPDDGATGVADLTLPAEAFIRLVYGRLDPSHTPAFEGDEADLDVLRRAFSGV